MSLSQVVLLISNTVKDFCQAEFVGRRDEQNYPIPVIPPKDRTGYALKEWTLLNFYSTGSLLGNSCQGTLKLANHSNEIQEEGYKFGKHLALAWQVMRSERFARSEFAHSSVNLTKILVM